MNFDLFIQSAYSFNGSLIELGHFVKKAKSDGFKTLGIADHNNLYGAVKFYEACLKEDIKPVFGFHTLLDVEGWSDIPILIYAMDSTGYKFILELISKINLENRSALLSDFSGINKHIALVFLMMPGGIYQSVLKEEYDRVSSLYLTFSRICPLTFFGLDLNDFTAEVKIAPYLEMMGKTIITNLVMMESKEDTEASNILKTILKEQPNHSVGLLETEEIIYDYKTPKELDYLYRSYSKMIDTTETLINQMNVSMDFTNRYIPKYISDKDYPSDVYLKALAEAGLKRRLQKNPGKNTKKDYLDRLTYELSIIHQMKYDDYFLIVWDFVLYAKKNNILVGPGRGSAAGSLVAYSLGITDVDPLQYDLYFERFLNPERITMPDIDMDFPDDKREQVLKYVTEKYGQTHVVSIITFGTFQGKSALRDASRILGLNETVISEITAYVGETDNSIDQFEEINPKKYDNLMMHTEVKHVFDIAKKLVGLPRHTSTHAAGIIFTEDEITSFCPVQPGLVGMYQTQFEASDLEKLGLLKIDFLGLKNLSTIQNVLDKIEEDTKEKINLYSISLEDKKTFQLFKQVNTLGIFQLESSGMMNLLRKMQLDNFEEIATAIALFRPGPVESIPSYIRRRNHEEKIAYPDPLLEPILKSTEGIIIYQEQIMQIASTFAGYSLGEADVLRRAVSKKKESILLEERERFLNKCKELKRDEASSNVIYDYIVKFANYGFNKSHAVAYGLVAYWMAYLKANYPQYFMSTLLDASIGSKKATADYIKECRKMDMHVLPPSINESRRTYTRENNDLRFPTIGIKNVGVIVEKKLDEIREHGRFHSFIDFVHRAKDINIRVIESFILVGMFDEFSLTKKTMIENLKQLIAYRDLPSFREEDFKYIPYEEYDFSYLQEQEKELIGFNLRYHPMTPFIDELEKKNILSISDLQELKTGYTRFAGYFTRMKVIQTKNNDSMAFLTFEDAFSEAEAVLFPRDYETYKAVLVLNQVYYLEGKLEMRNNKLQVVISKINKLGDSL